MIRTSYRVAVKVRGESTPTGNSLRFATAKEARAYGRDLAGRWTLVESWRIKATQDPPNYRWDQANGTIVALPETAAPIAETTSPSEETP
jgi:hypothetical protein